MKAAIYCRLSEEDKNKACETDDSGSIKNQKALLQQYAIKQGWEIADIYSDDDYTGSDRRRPEFNRLLADAQQGRFDIVLCKTQSRFTRELELVEKYIHGLFPLWGIRFVSIVDNADTANRGNKKSRQINGLVNEWYLEDMSENIRSVLDNRRQNGFHIGAFALYGYAKDPDQKGHLIIDEEAAAVVQEVFTLFSQGCGKTAIARILNSRGIPNPTEYKRLRGLRYRQPKTGTGALWSYAAISHMLTNEIYIGNMVQGKYGSVSYKTKQNRPRPRELWYRVEGTHEPIIDRRLWDSVQALIAQKAKPFAGGSIGLFAGKARCACCGSSMRSSKSGDRRYLRCSARYASKEACQGAFISVDRLEQLVIEELRRLSAEYLDEEALARGIPLCGGLKAQKARLVRDVSACEKKAADQDKALHTLYLDRIRGIVSERDYIQLSKEFSAARGRLEQAIAAKKSQLSSLEEALASEADSRGALVRQYARPQRLTRQMVEILIDEIAVGRRIPGTRDVPIEIHWSF